MSGAIDFVEAPALTPAPLPQAGEGSKHAGQKSQRDRQRQRNSALQNFEEPEFFTGDGIVLAPRVYTQETIPVRAHPGRANRRPCDATEIPTPWRRHRGTRAGGTVPVGRKPGRAGPGRAPARGPGGAAALRRQYRQALCRPDR
ncbi:protein of unknown function [Cupriavidus taiwanensis]|nr:protein of unknown function [Cupriavidus taiwanensis]